MPEYKKKSSVFHSSSFFVPIFQVHFSRKTCFDRHIFQKPHSKPFGFEIEDHELIQSQIKVASQDECLEYFCAERMMTSFLYYLR